MIPEQYRTIKRLFADLVDRSPSERAARLAQEPEELRTEVERLLAAADAPDRAVHDVLEGGGAAVLAAEFEQPAVPATIDRYHIEGVLGEGGMGTVYAARQQNPDRRVAVKVIRAGARSNETLVRFRREAEVLGQLQHPGIAHIYEAGIARIDGLARPYFAMELIEGRPIDRFVRDERLGRDAVLELVARIADAVQHAHQKGVVHRDLKPPNVLVASSPERTSSGTGRGTSVDAIGRPVVLDFGVSRIQEDGDGITRATRVGQVVGTLGYMAPEQVSGGVPADTRCDVYALGVILFELLAGQRPFDLTGLSIAAASRVIEERDPPKLGTLAPSCRGDVETVVRKALEKSRDQRYASAAALADDLRRCVRDEPIAARPATAMYQIRKFARRNKGLVGGLAATFVVLAGALVAVSVLLTSVATQRDEATTAKRRQDEVARFLASVLQNIDVEPMGEAIIGSVQGEIETWSARRPDELDAALPELVAFLDDMDAANIARASFETNLIDRAVAALDDGYSDDPVVEATLRETVAQMYNSFYRFGKQLVQDQRAHSLRRAALGALHPDTVRSIDRCADAAEWAMQRELARDYCHEAIDGFEHLYGPEDPRTVRARIRLAGLLTDDQPREAESILLDVIDLLSSRPDEHDQSLTIARTRLAAVYGTLGRDEESIALYEALIAEHQDENAAALWSSPLCQNLAGTYARVGRLDDAEALIRRVIDDWQRRFGDDHEATIVNRLQLGAILIEQDDPDAAVAVLRTAHESSLRGLPPDRSHRAHAAMRLATCLIDRSALDDAERVLNEAVETRMRVVEDEWTASLLDVRARCLRAQGRAEPAAEAEAEARRIREAASGSEGPR